MRAAKGLGRSTMSDPSPYAHVRDRCIVCHLPVPTDGYGNSTQACSYCAAPVCLYHTAACSNVLYLRYAGQCLRGCQYFFCPNHSRDHNCSSSGSSVVHGFNPGDNGDGDDIDPDGDDCAPRDNGSGSRYSRKAEDAGLSSNDLSLIHI